jgi:hypothetical protein
MRVTVPDEFTPFIDALLDVGIFGESRSDAVTHLLRGAITELYGSDVYKAAFKAALAKASQIEGTI